MARPIIPPDRKGYMVVDGVVHTRYATHVPRGPRYRTIDETWMAVLRVDYSVCAECYPPPPEAKRQRRAQPARTVRVRVSGGDASPATSAGTAVVYTAPARDPEVTDSGS